MTAAQVDFKAYHRIGAGYDLVPMSARARTYLMDRRSSAFSRRGVAELVSAGWRVVEGRSA